MTGYKQAGTDVGTILSTSTFSTVAGSITSCGYKTNINQYNTGRVWAQMGSGFSSSQGVDMTPDGKFMIRLSFSIFYSTNFGDTWIEFTNTVSSYAYNAASISYNGQIIVAAAGFSKIIYSTNSGSTWTTSTSITGATNAQWESISISSSGQYGIACIFGISGRIYYTSNNGATWTQSDSIAGQWYSLSMSSSGQYCLALKSGTSQIYYSINFGINWIVTNSLTTGWNSTSISDSGQYAVASTANNMYYSSNYGVTWTISPTPTSTLTTTRSISISSSGQYAVVGCDSEPFNSYSVVYYSNNFGVNWNTLENINAFGLTYFIKISGSGEFAVNSTNNSSSRSFNTSTTSVSKDLTEVFEPLYKYPTWTVVSGTSTQVWSCVSLSYTGQYGIAGAGAFSSLYYGVIHYTSNYGASWTASNSVSNIWSSVAISGSGQYGIGCVEGGRIYYSSDFGATWTVSTITNTNTNYGWSGVSISSNGKYGVACYASQTAGYIANSSDFGVTWTRRTTGSPNTTWQSVSISDRGFAIACQGNGRIYFSTDFGTTWNVTTVGGLTTSFTWWDVSISSSGQYGVATDQSSQVYYSSNINSGSTPNWIQASFPAINGSTSSVSISDSGQYAIMACNNAFTGSVTEIYYSNNYGVTWVASTTVITDSLQGVAISGNGQYGITVYNNTGTAYNIYRCIATN